MKSRSMSNGYLLEAESLIESVKSILNSSCCLKEETLASPLHDDRR